MRTANFQSGIGIKCGDNKSITLGTLGGLYSLTNSEFTFIFNATFLGTKENYFFGGTGDTGRDLYIIRNVGGSNDGSLRLSITDGNSNTRVVTWDCNTPSNTWNNIIINSSASGDDNLKLFVDGVEQTISSQTNDIGFAPDEDFDLLFGEVNSGVIDDFIIAGPIQVYDRSISTDEISNIQLGIYPTDFLISFSSPMPSRGLHEVL